MTDRSQVVNCIEFRDLAAGILYKVMSDILPELETSVFAKIPPSVTAVGRIYTIECIMYIYLVYILHVFF